VKTVYFSRVSFWCCAVFSLLFFSGFTQANTGQTGVVRSSASIEIAHSSKVIKRLENEYIKVVIYSDATADLSDKATNTKWRMGPVAFEEPGPIDIGHVWLRSERSICEQYPGRFRGTAVGDSLRFTMLGRLLKPMGQFTCNVKLDGPWLEFTLSDIDEELESLVFPTPIKSGSLVFPKGVGLWLRKPLPERRFWTFFSHLNMRWFGGLKDNNNLDGAGWIAIFNKKFADAGVMAAEMSASPGWLKSLGKWSYPRTIRYRFTTGGYVGLAKAYRAWFIDAGLFRSLKEKMKRKPALGNLLGGRILSITQAYPAYTQRWFEDRLRPFNDKQIDGKMRIFVTHSQAGQIIAQAKELGMSKGLAILRGWIHGGYDWSHPDIWPPESRLGTLEELKGLCSMAGPVSVGLHDNYQDIYEQCPSFPNGVIRLADGRLLAGGYWAGGQAYILNSGNGVKYARRNWENIKTLKPAAMYIDTTTAVQNYQSFEPGNIQTRSQDVEQKAQLLKFFSDKGIVLGSEWGADFGILNADYASARHSRVAGESIPLWPLVFHDAIFSARFGSAAGKGKPGWLENMLWGYVLSFHVRGFDGWKEQAEDFKSTLCVDRWNGRIGAEQMTDHKFLTDDFAVEQTTFGNGLSIIVNFSKKIRTVDGTAVPGWGYVIRQ